MFCSPCAQYKLRTWVLNDNMAAYKCCQGYFDTCCFRAGGCGDEGNPCCLCVEVICCPGLAVQGSKFYLMDTRNIMPSETDNKLARYNNFLQILACLCRLADCDGAEAVTLAADLFFTSLVGCMSAQVAHELKAEASGKASAPPPGSGAPHPMSMQRSQIASAPVVLGPPQGMGQPMQPVMQGQPVMAPQPFMVQVPPGVAPGGMMMVQSPISGQMMQVQVPYNVPPGGTFQVMG